MNLNISSMANEKVGGSLLITGTARSGTTIVGKLVHSFKNVDLSYEPPLLLSLMSLIHTMDEMEWRLLYETYLYEDFYLGAMAGRSLNTNQVDDSSIFRVKTQAEVNRRLTSSLKKSNFEGSGIRSMLAWKTPDLIPFLGKLIEYYPKMHTVIVKRNAIETINSLIQKGWFSNERNNKNEIWPFILNKNHCIPFWVKPEDYDFWINVSELDRCAYYYIRMNDSLEKLDSVIEIKYSKLLESPYGVTKTLSEKLGLEFGEMTQDIIGTVEASNVTRNMSLISKITSELRGKVEYYSELSE